MGTLRNIRVVGFDLDQTLYPKSPLIDERIQEYLYEAIAEHRKVDREAAKQLFKERYRDGSGLSGRQTLEELGLPNAGELVQEALERADITSLLVPDVETNALLAEIHSRYEGMDLITGSNERGAEEKLKALGLATSLFTNVITADRSTKSNGDSYRLWLSLYPQHAPEHFLYVGDRVRTDHEIPASLGIRTALVYVPTPDPALACLQCTSLGDLRSILL